MYSSKFILKSKTVIGILTMALVQLAPEFGFSFTEDDSAMVNSTVDAVVTAIGSILALIGRWTARDSLTLGASDRGTTLRASAWVTVLALFLVLFVGCANVPSHNHSVVMATQTIAELARQTDRLQQNGIISTERENHILDQLADANSQLRLAESLLDGCPEPCRDADSILITVNAVLTDIENELRSTSQ